jgi:hypothetical protein
MAQSGHSTVARQERLLSWALLGQGLNGNAQPLFLFVVRMAARRFSMSAFGTKRTFKPHSAMSAFGGKADIDRTCGHVRF